MVLIMLSKTGIASPSVSGVFYVNRGTLMDCFPVNISDAFNVSEEDEAVFKDVPRM
jgi:hypothetical protein